MWRSATHRVRPVLGALENALLERAAAGVVGRHPACGAHVLDPNLMRSRCLDCGVDLVAHPSEMIETSLTSSSSALCEPVDLRARRGSAGVHTKIDPHFERRLVVLAHGKGHGGVHQGCNAQELQTGSAQLLPRLPAELAQRKDQADGAPAEHDRERFGLVQMWWWSTITSRVSFVK